MTIDDIIRQLDDSAAVLWNMTVSAAELGASAEKAREVVRTIDASDAGLKERRAQALAAMTQPTTPGGQLLPPRKTVAQISAHLKALNDEKHDLAVLRELATSLAAQLDGRARERKIEEDKRDEARAPFAKVAKRAHEHDRRVNAEYPRLAERIRVLFGTDQRVAGLGVGALTRCPRDRGQALAREMEFVVPCVIAVDAVMMATRLPGFWPPKDRDFQRLDYECDEAIVRPLKELIKNQDARRIAPSHAEVEEVILRAQRQVVGEFANAVAALRELLVFDATIGAEDRLARYPDGAPIFDPKSFPNDLAPGLMGRRIALPDIAGMARAAE